MAIEMRDLSAGIAGEIIEILLGVVCLVRPVDIATRIGCDSVLLFISIPAA